jgi:hypothetical protein
MPSCHRLFAAIVLFCLCAVPVFAGPVTFATQTYAAPTSSFTGFTVAADIDKDGNPDLITTDLANSQLLIFYGTGGGNFAAPTVVALLGSPAVDLKVGDFNGDGKLDIIVVCGNGNTIGVLTGNGNRTFNYTSIATTDSPYFVAVGDFNNDGKLDFAAALVTSSYAGYIQIYYGNGDVTFTAGATIPLPGTLFNFSDRLIAADLNQDGRIDLVNAAEPTTVFLNNGDGTFTLAQTINAPGQNGLGNYVYGDVGDLNGDAVPDLLLSNSGFCGPGCGYFDDLDSYLNDGTGHFTLTAKLQPQGDQVTNGVLADLNYDHKNDVLYTYYYSGGQLGFALGVGDGTFHARQSGGALNQDYPPLLARDLNNDGQMDIVSTGQSNLIVLLNTSVTPDCASPNSSALASNVCSPLPGATVSPTFAVRAAANAPVDVLRIEEWLDGKKVYQQLSNQIRNELTATLGVHTLSVVSIDVLNNVSKNSFTFTVGCGAPATAGVKICTPVANATVKSPAHVTAAATAASGTSITAMRLYVDNVSEYTVNGATLNTSVTLATGSHNLVVVGYEANGGAQVASETITVQ